MTETASSAAEVAEPALYQRLRAVAPLLLDPSWRNPAADDDPYAAAGVLLDAVVRGVQEHPGGGRLWLLLVALTGEFPLHDDIERVRRTLELHHGVDAQQVLLEACLDLVVAGADTLREMDVVTDRPIVDVHFSAGNELMTGIQRVVRHTVPRWTAEHDLVLAGWTRSGTALRRLTAKETDRIVAWGRAAGRDAPVAAAAASPGRRAAAAPVRLLVPWHVPVILPEVPNGEHAERLAALGQHSGSPLRLLGYDCIPIVSPDLVAPHDHEKFVSYLEVVKVASTVAAISESSAEEFAGFSDMLRPQGLPGPRVLACPLPSGPGSAPTVSPGAAGPASSEAGPGESAPSVLDAEPALQQAPVVVCVGSIDARKNQYAVLEAAERLWREGLRFSLRFLGSGGLPPAGFVAWLEQLAAAGRPVTITRTVDDAALTRAVKAARFTVFPSLHEGYGLPVVESLALGVPVLTSDVGSMRELADGRGGLVVDPRDNDAVTDAMRRLLTDDALLADLTALALAQPSRTWGDYASELWRALVAEDPVE